MDIIAAVAEADAPELIPVRLVDGPVETWWRLGQHEDELIRECAILALDGSAGRHPPPVRLVLLVKEIFTRFGGTRNHIAEQVGAARARGDRFVTVEVAAPAEVVPAIEHALSLFEEIDTFCEAGAMLTMATSGDGRTVRRWITEEFVRQVRDGRSPRPAPRSDPQREDAAGPA